MIDCVSAQETVVDQGTQTIECGHRIAVSCHGPNLLERGTAGKGSQTPEQLLLGGGKKIVSPADRVPERLLAFWQIPRAPGQQLQTICQAGEQLGRGEQLRSCR